MTELVPVHRDDQIQQVAELARTIWNEHFPMIIGQEQVDYMVDKFQSREAIQGQIQHGYQYYLIRYDLTYTGYIALVPQPERLCLQISKLYILRAWRGRGIARESLEKISGMAARLGLHSLYLTVNKYNHTALAAYRKLGFVRKGELVADIGNGYVMDDYEMELPVIRNEGR